MNATEKKCAKVEQVCEALIGGAMSIYVTKNVFPKCNTAEKVVVTLGTGIVGWMAGRAFAKQFYKFCDVTFGTDFEDVYENL